MPAEAPALAVCPASAVALRDVYRQLCFAWLTRNGDPHAKHLSVVAVDGEWRVAPAYALPNTLPYRDHTMALAMGGRTADPSLRILLDFAARIGLAERAATRTLDQVLAATEPVVEEWRAGAVPSRRRPSLMCRGACATVGGPAL